MKLTRYRRNPILKPNSKLAWEAESVLNPCVIQDRGKFHAFYRATAKPQKSKIKGWKEWRVSSIGHAVSKDGIHFRKLTKPLIKPEGSWESLGCEDPRVTKVGRTFWITYTAVSNDNKRLKVRIALASTKDFKTIRKHGVIGPSPKSAAIYTKAATIFPGYIDGKHLMLLTYNSDTPHSTIYTIKFKNFSELIKKPPSFWSGFIADKSNVFLAPSKSAHRGPEIGAPPVKTKRGWLLVFCPESKKKEWTISAALLDLENPKKIIWQSKNPILKPEKPYEKKGIVNQVTFPSGAVIVSSHKSQIQGYMSPVISHKLFVYYGAGDKCCCLATGRILSE